MKKYLLALLSVIILLSVCTGCNRSIDIIYKFDKAIVSLPDGTVVSGDVQSWTDYEGADQIQVKIDGITYLVHSSNIVLIKN